jgi:putative transposase
MASHVFHEIYLHINWHTKNDQRLLTPKVEPLVHNFLRERCRATPGVYLHEVGGTEDHVHLAINIEPFVTISDLIGELKGASSHAINEQMRYKALEWQRGYGVVSFGRKQLDWVVAYVRNQKQHHAEGSTHHRLERTSEDEPLTPEGRIEKPG